MIGRPKTLFDFKSHRLFLVPLLTALFISAGINAAEARRLALVVGNSEYSGVSPLKNASRDATDIAEALGRLGFEVTLLTDVKSNDFWDRIEAFGKDAETAEATVFFYSGHAFQMNGSNYLVPVDAKLSSREAIQTETWNLDGIIARIQDRKRQTLIFLDACRNDPLPQSVRGSGNAADGLARLQTGVGTFVAFATEPGAVTYDGAGEAPNSPFTTALLENIETPGISVSDMMINVRNEVEERTFRRQTPWDQSSLREQFYFTPAVETKQELSEADYELLAQLSPDDRKKFLDLLRASGFSDDSLREADVAIEVASLNLELATSDGGISIGDASEAVSGSPEVMLSEATEPTAQDAVKEEEFVFDLVDGGVTIGDAPAAETPAEDIQVAAVEPEQTAPLQETIAQTDSQSIASVEETDVALLPKPDSAPAATGSGTDEEAPIRLAALSWETRGIIGINAITVDRLRVAGNEITPDNEANRSILAAIDPSLLIEQPDAADSADLAADVQTELRRLGCYQMRIDGNWGRGSRTALTSYFLAKRSVPDTLEPTAALLDQLQRDTKVVCEVRVSRVAPSKRIAKPEVVQTAAPVRKINPKTGRKQNAPAVVKKEIKKSLLGSGSF